MNEVLGHPSSTMKSKYKYVRYNPGGFIDAYLGSARNIRKLADTPWVARPFINVILGDTQSTKGPTKRFATEREAALFVDKWFISQGREPVNILKPKR